MKAIVDRIEGEVVILEIDSEIKDYPLDKFPKDIKEGDIVIWDRDRFKILKNDTLKRKKEMENLLKSLFNEE